MKYFLWKPTPCKRVKVSLYKDLYDHRMDMTKAGLWLSLFVGGLLVALISSFTQYNTKAEGEEFRVRSVVRDFCLGAVVSATVYSFLPESVDELVTTAAASVAALKPVEAAEIELQTGPARF